MCIGISIQAARWADIVENLSTKGDHMSNLDAAGLAQRGQILQDLYYQHGGGPKGLAYLENLMRDPFRLSAINALSQSIVSKETAEVKQ